MFALELDLILPLEFILSGDFHEVLLKCLIICPGIPQLLGLVFESRWVPWSPKYQFLAFMPGNPFLALFISLCSRYAQPAYLHEGLWTSPFFQWVALAGAGAVYGLLMLLDYKSNYTKAQLVSATKIYHNSLYFWYSYLGVIVFSIMLASEASVWEKVLVTLPGLVWIGCLVIDATTSESALSVKFRTAHTDNHPIWREWQLRRIDEYATIDSP